MPSTSGKLASYEKHCKCCNSTLVLRSKRDIERKTFCSFDCKAEYQKTQAPPARRPYAVAKKCECCGIDFVATDKLQKFCNPKCQSKNAVSKRLARNATLEGHLKRLLVYKQRKNLSLEFLTGLYKRQNGLCALSGVPMTWEVLNGKVSTNLSLDRIDSSQGYTEDNVQLVCRIVNIMKNNLSVDEFVGWCKLIEVHNAF